MDITKKPCKGTGLAKGYGCGKLNYKRTYGLGEECRCYQNWLFNAPEAEGKRSKFLSSNKKKVVKEKKQEEVKIKKSRPVSSNFNIYTTTAWKWCSRFVLLSYADDAGIVRCSTSPELSYHVTDPLIHCGHFIKYREGTKSNNAVAFDFRNLAPQSSVDNVRFNGKPEIMHKWLISMHGQEEIDKMIIKSHEICKFTKYDLDEIAKNYRILFNDLLKKRNINNPWA